MTPEGIISAIIIGAVIGILGRLLVRGRQRISLLLTIVIGIVAALIGTYLASLVGVQDTAGVDWIELLFQVVLAAIGVAAVSGSRGSPVSREAARVVTVGWANTRAVRVPADPSQASNDATSDSSAGSNSPAASRSRTGFTPSA